MIRGGSSFLHHGVHVGFPSSEEGRDPMISKVLARGYLVLSRGLQAREITTSLLLRSHG